MDYWTEADRKPVEDATLAATTAAGRADAAAATATEGEASRVAAETARANAEAARAKAEQAREGAETWRVEAEATRAANESKRTETFNTNLVSWNGKVDAACKKATDTASKAAQDAKTATDAAIAKTEEATNAAVAKADKATASATTAANKAEAAVAQLPVPSGNVLKGTGYGTLVNLHDAWKAPILKGKVLGQSNQITTKGINLVNHANPLHASGNVPFRGGKLKNGFVIDSLPDTKNDNRIAVMKVLGGIKAGDTIVVSCNYRKLSGNIEIPSLYLSDAPQEYGIALNRPFTVKNNHSLVGVYVDADSNSKIEITDFQLIKSSQPLPYEPYTGGKPSPSPDYPQEITNLNKAEIVVSGKNLLEQPKRFYNCGYAQGKPSAYTSSMVTLPFTTQAESNGIGFTFDMKQGVTYTVSIVNAPKFTYSLRVGQYKQQEDIYSHANLIAPHIETNQKPSLAFTAVDNGVALVMLGGKWTNGNTNVGTIEADIRFQVEVGNQQTSYEPYISKSTPIDLKGNELCSLPNVVKDEVVIDAEGNVSLIKRVGSCVIDKSWDWNKDETQNGSSRFVAYVHNQGANHCTNTDVKCRSKIGICSPTDTWLEKDGCAVQGFDESTNCVFMYIKSLANETVDTFKQWITDNPFSVMYPLAEPQTIPLGKVELPALPEATSNVWNDGNIPANVYVQYLKDVNIAFADLESKLTQAVVATAANL